MLISIIEWLAVMPRASGFAPVVPSVVAKAPVRPFACRLDAGNLSEAIHKYSLEGSSRAVREADMAHGKPRTASNDQLLEQSPALVLNSDYQPLSYMPLSVWSWQDAVKAVFMGRVVVVAEYSECVVRSANFVMRVPSVIALRTYQKRATKVPHFTRRNVYIRDQFACQYCHRQYRPSVLTYDHVLPRSRGGATSWDNVVTACTVCNNRKGSLLLSDFQKKHEHLKLKKQPYAPSQAELVNKARRLPIYRNYHETWGAYVGTPDSKKSFVTDRARPNNENQR
ncbi:hypothetical protein CTAYLR_009610 [Chrysophaeum taylorii]|uniref:HNH nuclease domain-containing protein n=1 Tax=Chrysophaeum taylorii TaxID=2483200 RepID=A0AAD7UQF7_9STRA|nr:hypothetical protein CTAYLR_009610 [Chrysophaeum taylorii]